MTTRASKRARSDGDAGEAEVSAEVLEAGRVYAAFTQFAQSEHAAIAAMERKVSRIDADLLALLPAEALPARWAQLHVCATANADFVASVFSFAKEAGVLVEPSDGSEARSSGSSIPRDVEPAIDELRAVLHSVVREWSAEGAAERDAIFTPIVAALSAQLESSNGGESAARVLVPGSGLGRLPAELCRAGFDVEANELSLQMLLVGAFVANCMSVEAGAVATIHPFIHQAGNHRSSADQTRSVSFPDVTPLELAAAGSAAGTAAAAAVAAEAEEDDADEEEEEEEEGEEGVDPWFRTVSGDFVELYGVEAPQRDRDDLFDGIVTCWFIDTAPCVLTYINAFFNIMPVGGVWVNYGPLLFHWASPDADEDASDDRFARSLELPWSAVRSAIIKRGFSIEHEEWKEGVTYTANKRSMQRTVFDCVFFVAIKRK